MWLCCGALPRAPRLSRPKPNPASLALSHFLFLHTVLVAHFSQLPKIRDGPSDKPIPTVIPISPSRTSHRSHRRRPCHFLLLIFLSSLSPFGVASLFLLTLDLINPPLPERRLRSARPADVDVNSPASDFFTASLDRYLDPNYSSSTARTLGSPNSAPRVVALSGG